VIVANIVIAHKFNNYTGWGEITCAVMIMNFFTIYFLENLLSAFPIVYLIFDATYMTPIIQFGLVFIVLQTSAFEMVVARLHALGFVGESTDHIVYEEKHFNEKLAHKQSLTGGQPV
jgi:ABC-type xylose transport system permease subunit